MAEEHRVGKNSGEALIEVGEQSHARHDVWSKIQKMEAKCVHDIVEEIGERGAKAARKIIEEERVPIRGGLGAIGGDDTRGWMPRRLPPSCTPIGA